MAYSYKGAISFGLVYIPITLHAATKENTINFNLLDKNTMSRIQYTKSCVNCGGAEVTNDNIVKGYRYDDDKYIIFEEEDFEKLKSKKDKNITIEQFVELQEIDPVYFKKSYYVVPTGGERAFALLREALESENKVGIAKTVLGTKETLIALRVLGGDLVLSTMYFYDEIQPNPIKQTTDLVIDPEELKLAKMLINNLSGPFEPEKYHNEYNQKIQAAIEAKIAGKEFSAQKDDASRSIANLMDALTESLKATTKKTTPKKRTRKPKTERPQPSA